MDRQQQGSTSVYVQPNVGCSAGGAGVTGHPVFDGLSDADRRPSPSPYLSSRVPAALPEQGLLQPAPALRVPLRLPRSPL